MFPARQRTGRKMRNGKLLASAEVEEIRLWDVPARKLIHRFPKHANYLKGLAFSADNKHLLSWSPNRIVSEKPVRDSPLESRSPPFAPRMASREA